MSNQSERWGSVIAINFDMFFASILFGAAWLFVPTSSEWWQSGVLSVCLALGGISALARAVRRAFSTYQKEIQLHALEAGGVETHDAGFVEGKARDAFRAQDLK